jgi:hypothetical protein
MRHHRQGVLNWFVRRVLDGDPILVYGTARRSATSTTWTTWSTPCWWPCVRRLARGGLQPRGNEVRLKDLAELLVRLNGSGEVRIVPYPQHSKEVEIGDYIADTSKIEKRLGWTARSSVAEGFGATLEYYRRHRDRYWTA